jgi:hypothetical protein
MEESTRTFMNEHTSQALYLVDPRSERFLCWLRDAVMYVARLYWDLFISLPLTIMSMSLALVASVMSLIDLFQNPSRWLCDVILLSLGIAFLVSSRVRTFFWALVACAFLWIPLIVSVMRGIIDFSHEHTSTPDLILIALFCFLPPIVAALLIERVRHRGVN